MKEYSVFLSERTHNFGILCEKRSCCISRDIEKYEFKKHGKISNKSKIYRLHNTFSGLKCLTNRYHCHWNQLLKCFLYCLGNWISEWFSQPSNSWDRWNCELNWNYFRLLFNTMLLQWIDLKKYIIQQKNVYSWLKLKLQWGQ